MEFFKRHLLVAAHLCLTLFIFCEENQEDQKQPIQKNHLLFLVKANKIESAIDHYFEYKQQLGKHDSELLEQIAMILIDEAMSSKKQEKEITSLYGASLAGVNSILDLCESAIKSRNPQTQLVSIQMLGQIHDDRANILLCKAFSSDFFEIRLEAANCLAQRKYIHAVGYIESLMHKIPPFFHYLFSEMFAYIGTTEATNQLKKMIHSGELFTRVAATLSAAQFNRDDLLKDIRTAATHLNPAEQEACAFALGALSDSSSISLLEKLSKSEEPEVSIAALNSLSLLGKKESIEHIFQKAKEENLFAITILANIEGSEDFLAKLLHSKDRQIKYNAALALLKRKDIRCLDAIKQLLLSRRHDFAFIPQFSLGRSLSYWKVLPSLSVLSKGEKGESLSAISLALREQILVDFLSLGQEQFLSLASLILKEHEKELTPLLMELLTNLNSDSATEFLKEKAEELGSPFIRNYACLALAKMKKEPIYSQRIESWVRSQKKTEMFQFRPITTKANTETNFTFQLTPKENSALLIQTLLLFSLSHEEKAIEIILEMIKSGHPNNRPILAGLLMKTIE